MAEDLIKMLTIGIALDRCHPLDERKIKEPRHQKKLKGGRMMLQESGHRLSEVERMLQASRTVWSSRTGSAAKNMWILLGRR